MTARALDSIGRVGGPRCCKRDSWLAILAAVDFVRERLGVEMARTGSCLSLQQAQQPVHWEPLPLLSGESQKAHRGLPLRP